MKKSKTIKIIVLIILPILFLNGCALKWKDIEEALGTAKLEAGTSCVYYAQENYNNIEKITFYIDKTGLYLDFNDSNRTKLLDSSNTGTDKYIYNNVTYDLSDFGEPYFNIYKSSKGCPNSIYIDSSNNKFSNFDPANGNPLKHYAYTLEPKKVGDAICHNQNASVCDNNQLKDDKLIGTVFFEWGYQGNGEKYFWIAKDKEFSSYVSMGPVLGAYTAETDGGYISYKITKDSVKYIWLDDNKVIAKSQLDVSFDDPNNHDGFTTVYIFDKAHPIAADSDSSGEFLTIDGEKTSPNVDPLPIPGVNVNYNNICGDEGVSKVVKIIGAIINILRFVSPLLIIVLGVIDYVKAVTSSDEDALNKATESLIRRLISGVAIFFIPTLIWGVLNLLDITDGIHDLKSSEFGACTRCILKNQCSGSNSSNQNKTVKPSEQQKDQTFQTK